MATAADWMSALDDSLGTENAKDKHFGFLDTGLPMLNKALSGGYRRGFAQGKLVEIYGPSSSGKTMIATLAMKACQEKGGIAFLQTTNALLRGKK
jgi:RecA/RadA recombinase